MESTTPGWIGPIIAVGLAIIFGGIGVFLIILSIKNRKKVAESQSWPKTTAQIVDADVDQSSSTDSDGDISYTYSPSIQYTYYVHGTTLTGNKITIGFQQSYSTRRQAETALARYPIGTQVTVYYNPTNPYEAVLERTAGGGNVSMIIGVIFTLIGFISMIIGIAVALI